MKFSLPIFFLICLAFALVPQKKNDYAEILRAAEAQKEHMPKKAEAAKEKQKQESQVNDDSEPELDRIKDNVTRDEEMRED